MSGGRVKIYVSGASAEVERVREWVNALARTGLFSFDDPWWVGAEQWAGRDSLCVREEQVRFANAHHRAIRESSIFWMLHPVRHSYGAFVELGYALACRDLLTAERRVICVTGPRSSSSIFTGPADYREAVDALGFDYCVRIAREILGHRERGGVL